MSVLLDYRVFRPIEFPSKHFAYNMCLEFRTCIVFEGWELEGLLGYSVLSLSTMDGVYHL